MRTLADHTKAVKAVAVYLSGLRAISASADRTLKVWDLESGEVLHTLQGHGDEVHGVAVYDGGRRAISASDDCSLKVWDLESGVHLTTFSGDSAFMTCVVTPDDRTVVAGDGAGQVHILRLEGAI